MLSIYLRERWWWQGTGVRWRQTDFPSLANSPSANSEGWIRPRPGVSSSSQSFHMEGTQIFKLSSTCSPNSDTVVSIVTQQVKPPSLVTPTLEHQFNSWLHSHSCSSLLTYLWNEPQRAQILGFLPPTRNTWTEFLGFTWPSPSMWPLGK